MAGQVADLRLNSPKLMRDLEQFEAELERAVNDALEDVGADMVKVIRERVRRPPPGGLAARRGRPHDSRRQAAEGVGADVKDGRLRFRSDASKMAPGREAFPAAWSLARWSHPVFGHPTVARVSQRGNGPTIVPVVESYQSQVEAALRDAGQAALKTVKGDRA